MTDKKQSYGQQTAHKPRTQSNNTVNLQQLWWVHGRHVQSSIATTECHGASFSGGWNLSLELLMLE